MGIFSGLFRSRDKPKDSYDSPSYSYFFGRTQAGKRVNDRTAMQIIAVYACVRVLSEAIAQLTNTPITEKSECRSTRFIFCCMTSRIPK